MLFFFASCIHIYVIVMFGRCSVVSFQFFIVSDRLISFRWWEEVNSFYIDLIIYISEANWHLFDAQFLAIVLLARGADERNSILLWPGRKEEKNWKNTFILNGPTKSKPILLLIGTCCLIPTFTTIILNKNQKIS